MQAWTPSQSIRQARKELPELLLRHRRGIQIRKVPHSAEWYVPNHSRDVKVRKFELHPAQEEVAVPAVPRNAKGESYNASPDGRLHKDKQAIRLSQSNPLIEAERNTTPVESHHIGNSVFDSTNTKDSQQSLPTQAVASIVINASSQIHKSQDDKDVEEQAEDVGSSGRIGNGSPSTRNMYRSENLPRPPIMQGIVRGRIRTPLKIYEDYGSENHPRKRSEEYAFRLTHRSTSGETRHSPRYPKTIFHQNIKRGLKQNLDEAPFSTLFHINPFANALATPVREDCFSGAHLPNSCLIDFHLVDTGKESEKVSLLPISFAAALVSKKKKPERLTVEEHKAIDAREKAGSFEPEGSASYITGTEAAVQYVTQNPGKRVPTKVLSRRQFTELSVGKGFKVPAWEEDMPTIVLESLRKVVAKKLQWLFVSKQSKDNPGMLFEIPRGIDGFDLSRLNDVDAPSCVLKLTVPLASDEGSAKNNFIEVAEVSENTEEKGIEATGNAGHDTDPVEAEAAEEEHLPDDPSSESFSIHDNRPKSEKRQSGWWTSTVNRSLHAQTRPLPPPIRQILTTYPTLLFRNTALPFYDLPQLLGEERTRALVKGTVFVESRYLALGLSPGTVSVARWLLRLQLYLAKPRTYKALRRERKYRQEWVEEDGEEGVEKEDDDELLALYES